MCNAEVACFVRGPNRVIAKEGSKLGTAIRADVDDWDLVKGGVIAAIRARLSKVLPEVSGQVNEDDEFFVDHNPPEYHLVIRDFDTYALDLCKTILFERTGTEPLRLWKLLDDIALRIEDDFAVFTVEVPF